MAKDISADDRCLIAARQMPYRTPKEHKTGDDKALIETRQGIYRKTRDEHDVPTSQFPSVTSRPAAVCAKCEKQRIQADKRARDDCDRLFFAVICQKVSYPFASINKGQHRFVTTVLAFGMM